MMFIGRKKELQQLNDHYHSAVSEFCILYGRRRIGKSTILEEFIKDKASFFFLAYKMCKDLLLTIFWPKRMACFGLTFLFLFQMSELYSLYRSHQNVFQISLSQAFLREKERNQRLRTCGKEK